MHPSVRFVGAAALLAAPCVASATNGLAWKFDAPVRYHLEVRVDLPVSWRVTAVQNTEARVTIVEVELATTCKAVEGTRTGWDVECLIDGASIRGVPYQDEVGRLLPILVEWDELLTGATVQFAFGLDGRVRELELEGLGMASADRRTNDIAEKLTHLVVRAFAPLDLQLPKKGDDGGKGAWRQKESLVFGFPTTSGSLGSAVIEHKITELVGDDVDLATTGHGVMGPGETVMVGGSEQTANLYDLTVEGTARFDRATGRLISRDYKAVGTLTSSSIDAATSAGGEYVQVASLRWLVDDAPVPDLGPTGEIAE